VRRRELLSLVAGAVAWPLAARAQQKTPVIGFLSMTESTGTPGPFSTALREGLGETGFVEGRNVTFEHRWAEGNYDRLPALAADLVARKVDAIVAVGGPGPALAAKRATATIPIVFAGVGDPLVLGLVASLARPGGNLTGFSVTTTELMPKRFELLFDLVPRARVIALLINPKNEFSQTWIGSVQEAARAKGVELPILKAATETEMTRLSQPSPSAMPTRSFLAPIRSSAAAARRSWRWHRGTPSRCLINRANSLRAAA
jgi:putative ABC transport system substrate-binding protein